MLRVYCLLAVFTTSLVEQSSSKSSLIGQNVWSTKSGEFSFVVSLTWHSFHNPNPQPVLKHVCGGALITEKHVLTAAHCLKSPKSPYETIVKVNDGDLLNSTIYKIRKYTTYDKWAQIATRSPNDIAIIELVEKVHSSIKPAVFTSIPEAELHGKRAVIVGWGFTEDQRPSRYLLAAEIVILEAKECERNQQEDVKSFTNSTSHIFLCSTAEPSVHMERGDSGNPLLVNTNEIIAIHKGYCGITKNRKVVRGQNAHVSVNHYREFINDIIL